MFLFFKEADLIQHYLFAHFPLFQDKAAKGDSQPTTTPQVGETEKATTDAVKSVIPEGSPEWVQTAVQYGIPYAIGIVKVILILFVTWIIAGIIARIVTRALEKAKLDETLSKFFAKFTRWIILLFGLLACLSIFGVETTSFAAVIGAAGLAVGLAFQGTLANFASGVMLLVFRPFKVGQFVKVGGESGTIYEIDLFTTSLDTTDNRRIIIPNGAIFSSTIENVSHHAKRRVDVNVGTAYEADLDRTRQVFENILQNIDNRLDDPDYAVVLVDLGASSIDWQLRVWCKSEVFWDLKQDLMRQVKYALDREGIGIPYPQMEVHMAK